MKSSGLRKPGSGDGEPDDGQRVGEIGEEHAARGLPGGAAPPERQDTRGGCEEQEPPKGGGSQKAHEPERRLGEHRVEHPEKTGPLAQLEREQAKLLPAQIIADQLIDPGVEDKVGGLGQLEAQEGQRVLEREADELAHRQRLGRLHRGLEREPADAGEAAGLEVEVEA